MGLIVREPTNHRDDWYFCLTPLINSGSLMKKTRTVQYPNLPSVIWPIPLSDSLPVPSSPQHYELEIENAYSMEEESNNLTHSMIWLEDKYNKPHKLN